MESNALEEEPKPVQRKSDEIEGARAYGSHSDSSKTV